MQSEKSTRHLVNLVLKAVALAMGVAVVVINTLGTLTPTTEASLLGIAVAALAIIALGCYNDPFTVR
jgi:hypothetical protein